MRLPDDLPAPLALFNARHGVPCWGVFAPFVCAPDDVGPWATVIPWSVHILEPIGGRVALVLPPTHPGLCLLLDRLGAHVLTPDPFPRALLAGFGARVGVVDPSELGPSSVEVVVALAARGGPEAVAEANRIADRVLVPDGPRVIGWLGADGWTLLP